MRGGVRRSRYSGEATASPCCCPTARSSSSQSSPRGSWARSSRPSTRPTPSTSSRADSPTRLETLVTLTRFYQRIKHLQPRTGLRRVIATSIKDYLPPILRVLFTLFKEKKEGHRITLASATCGSPDLLARTAAAGRPRARSPPTTRAVILMSGGTTGTPKGVVGTARRATSPPACSSTTGIKAGVRRRDDVHPRRRCRCFTSTATSACDARIFSRDALALVPNPRDLADLIDDHPPRPPRLQRRADAVHRAAQPSGGEEREGRLLVDQDLFLRRHAAAGRTKPRFESSPAAASSRATR